MMKIIGVNGINNDGSETTDMMLRHLSGKGWDVHDFNYEEANAFSARWRCDDIAERLVSQHRKGDCVIAHSFGCAVVYEAMQQGAQFGDVFLFAPALSPKVTFPYHCAERISILTHPGDRAVSMGSRLLFHVFGKMGCVGYEGPIDKRVSHIPTKGDETLDIFKHSDYFRGGLLWKWSEWVHDSLKVRYIDV